MLRRTSILLLAIYSLLVIYTTTRLILGLPFFTMLTPVLTLLAFGFALTHGSQRLGWRWALVLLAITFAVSLALESVGVATGLIYGPYHYTDMLGPRFLGLAPYLIPVAWFMMTYPSLVITESLLPSPAQSWRKVLGAAAVGAVVMTAWDVAMDPMMVSRGHWVWEVDGPFFGVPLQNYWGWWLTMFLTFLLFYGLAHSRRRAWPGIEPAFDRLAVISYAVTTLNTVVTALMLGLGGAALAGLFAVLPWIIVGWRRWER